MGKSVLFCFSEGLGPSSHINVSFFLACAGTGLSHKSSWCYQQLSEGNVSLWIVTAALHNPDGNWSSCWYPDRSKREQVDVGMGTTEWLKAGVCRDNWLLQRQTEVIVFPKKVFQMPEMSASCVDNINVCFIYYILQPERIWICLFFLLDFSISQSDWTGSCFSLFWGWGFLLLFSFERV